MSLILYLKRQNDRLLMIWNCDTKFILIVDKSKIPQSRI